jgi:ribosomal protein S18 acetylase RimI-like enzyme
MIIKKANKNNKIEIQFLMDRLNFYRKKIFISENKIFHERVNPYPILKDIDFKKSIFFIAVDNNKIIGFIKGTIQQRKNHKLSKLGYVDELFVNDGFRGKGVAESLFLEFEKELKKQGCDHLITHTDFENDLSQRFYLKVGMNKTTVELWKKL